jgi:tight adherence protein B
MNPAWTHALILVCVFGAVVLAAESLVSLRVSSSAEAKAIQGRMKLIARRRDQGDGQALLRRGGSAVPEGLPAPVVAFANRLERMLIQARMSIETPRLLLILLVAPVAVFFGLLLMMALWWGIGISFGRIVMSLTFALVIGTILPLMAINWRATRARKKIEEQFPVALDVFVRGLRAGHPIAAALDLLTVEMPDPIGGEFGIVVDEVTYGSEIRDALQSMAERWDLADMRMFVVSLSIQSETGGNLAEILENLTKVIRDRQSMMLKVRALSSEGRLSAVMLTVLPLFTFTLLFVVNPQFFLEVANDPLFVPGFVCLIVLYLIGFFIIRRMVDLKV